MPMQKIIEFLGTNYIRHKNCIEWEGLLIFQDRFNKEYIILSKKHIEPIYKSKKPRDIINFLREVQNENN